MKSLLDALQGGRLVELHSTEKEASLRTLLAYNAEDVVNLVPLAELAFRELSGRLAERGTADAGGGSGE